MKTMGPATFRMSTFLLELWYIPEISHWLHSEVQLWLSEWKWNSLSTLLFSLMNSLGLTRIMVYSLLYLFSFLTFVFSSFFQITFLLPFLLIDNEFDSHKCGIQMGEQNMLKKWDEPSAKTFWFFWKLKQKQLTFRLWLFFMSALKWRRLCRTSFNLIKWDQHCDCGNSNPHTLHIVYHIDVCCSSVKKYPKTHCKAVTCDVLTSFK